MKKYQALVSLLLILLVFAVGCGSGTAEPQKETETTQRSEVAEIADELFLEITEPADEELVYTRTLSVSGKTLPDAVVSINGNITDVDYNGVFIDGVTLDIGPNVIEVIVSDFYGNEKSDIITVVYIPEE